MGFESMLPPAVHSILAGRSFEFDCQSVQSSVLATPESLWHMHHASQCALATRSMTRTAVPEYYPLYQRWASPQSTMTLPVVAGSNDGVLRPVERRIGSGTSRASVSGLLTRRAGNACPKAQRGGVSALHIEKTPTFEEIKAEAEAALSKAAELLPGVDEEYKNVEHLQKAAGHAESIAREAEARAAELGPRAEAALREARRTTMELQNQHEEISSADLRTLATSLLRDWKNSASPESFSEGDVLESAMSRLDGAVLIAQTAAAKVDGKKYVVMAIVIGERFPEGVLEGSALHWGCSGKGASWKPPPAGWHTIPPVSSAAGRAWQTPFIAHLPVLRNEPLVSDPAYGLVVQLPLEGFLKKDGGLNFVLKRPGGSKPEWVQGPHNNDFWVPFNLDPEASQDGNDASKGVDKQVANPFIAAAKSFAGIGRRPSANDGATSQIQRWVRRREEDAAPGNRGSVGEEGPLLQQYNSAISFLQSVFEKRSRSNGPTTAEEQYRQAKEMLSGAQGLIHESTEAQKAAAQARRHADSAHRAVHEAQECAKSLRARSELAVRHARLSAARLRGSEQEVGLLELQEIAQSRLKAWLSWVASRRSLEAPEEAPEEAAEEVEDEVEVSNFQMHGVDGWLTAYTASAEEGGRRFKVVSLAASEAFPEGVLDGAIAHWGVAGVGIRGGWETPPKGWQSDPDKSRAAGGGATESPLERVKVPGLEHRDDVAAHVLTLQLPLEGSAAKGGIKMVLRTADEQWLGCSFQGSRHDFFISLGKFGADQEEEGEAADSSDAEADGKPTQERLAQAIR